MRLDSLSFSGFQDCEDAEFRLGPVTVILGDMGKGKTAIVNAIAIGQTGEHALGPKHLKLPSDIYSQFGRGTDPMEINLRYSGVPDIDTFALTRAYKWKGKGDKISIGHTLWTNLGRGGNTIQQGLLADRIGTDAISFTIRSLLDGNENAQREWMLNRMAGSVRLDLAEIQRAVGDLPEGLRSVLSDPIAWLAEIRALTNDLLNARTLTLRELVKARKHTGSAAVGNPQVVAACEAKLEDLRAEKDRITERIARVDSSAATRSAIEESIAEAEERIAEIEAMPEALDAAVVTKNQSAATGALVNRQDEEYKAQTQLDAAQNAYQSATNEYGQLDDLNRRHGEISARLADAAGADSKIEELEAQLSEARDLADGAEADLAEEQENLASLERDLAEVERDRDDLTKQQIGEQVRINYLRDNLAVIRSGTCSLCHHEIDAAKADDLAGSLDRSEQALAQIAAKLETALERHAEIVDACTAQDQVIEQQRVVASTQRQTVERLQVELTEAQDNAGQLAELGMQSERIEDAIAVLTDAKSAVERLEAALQSASALKRAAEATRDSATRALDDLKAKIETRRKAHEELPALRDKVERFQAQLAEATSGDDREILVEARAAVDAKITEQDQRLREALDAMAEIRQAAKVSTKITRLEEEVQQLAETVARIDGVRREAASKIVGPTREAMRPFLGGYAEFDVLLTDEKGRPAFRPGLVRNGLFRGLPQLCSGESALTIPSFAVALASSQEQPGYSPLILDAFERIGITHRENILRRVVDLVDDGKICQAFVTCNETSDRMPSWLWGDERITVIDFWPKAGAIAAEG